MTREEFGRVVAYITAATGKALEANRLEVFFDLLGDLPFDVLLSASRRVCLEHPWNTFPSVAEIRAAAVLSQRGDLTDISPSQAWEMAQKFRERFDPDIQGEYVIVLEGKRTTYPSQFHYLTHKLPKSVVAAIRTFGPLSLSVGDEPTGVLRAQFMETYQQIVASERREAILPEPLKREIEAIGKLPSKITKVIGEIGKPPEDKS